MNSVWYVEIGLVAAGDEGATRANEMIKKLRDTGWHVDGSAPTWRTVDVDSETFDAAREALRAQLDTLDPQWADVLVIDPPKS